MTKLSEYYDGLSAVPEPPKTKFVREVSLVCGVSEMTVRSWIKGRAKPSNPDHLEILSKATGIPKDELFKSPELL